jgi:hypothetical protein
MRKISLFKRAEADRKANTAPLHDTVELDMAELDHVAGCGGKAGASTNPVDD